MSAQLKRKIEADNFKRAICEWLSGEVSGNLSSYMYTDDADDHRWKDGHSAASYYYGRDEKASLSLALDDLDIEADSLLDLGPGGESSVLTKTIPLMNAVKAKNYFPVDLSPVLANEALARVKQSMDANGSAIITDFFDYIPGTRKNALLAIMGGTIGNFETYTNAPELRGRLSQIFSVYRNAVEQRSHCLISIDANDNGQEIVDCYNNPEFGGLIRSCVERIINTDGFDYHVAWTPENFQLATGLRSNRDQIINVGSEQFAIEKGEYLPVLNSYRFPVHFVQEAAAHAGWQYQKSWSASGRVHYLLFKRVV